ncbi:helicase C-terminal domain-containing protein [Aerosakkonema funiforme]|uniref:Helicase n=1 Tax=Aerosakkonema funiforme FACHB-1375 TaxID=2949571 RepID=A0A926VCA7_9CYAN|nr:helicase C-terminal domain-containing protein [Aerosakkonema funiforme]MBD2181202.1 helicase [Aerosakkonema funiforme FACHB-1375]
MIAANLGRLFEVGFNTGILAGIQHHQIEHNFGNLYQRDLQHLQFPKMLQRILSEEQVISQKDIQIIEKWCLYLLQKGFLSGLNFFGEYIKSTRWNNTKRSPIEILYYQCSFGDANSIKTYPKSEEQEYTDLLSQFGNYININNLKRYIDRYKQKGEFLKADTLMLLRYKQEFRILAIDLSIFSVKSAKDLLDFEDKDMQNQRRLLLREISYLRSKSVFSKLRIDTGATDKLGFDFGENLTRYFTAFKREDKESAKLIQAGSYARSFYEFLCQTDILNERVSVVFNVVGYSDRGIGAMSLRPENLDVLRTCSQIYRNEPREQEIDRARNEVLNLIQLNAGRSFQDGRNFVKQLLEIPSDTTTIIPHTEKIDNFSSTLELREPHAKLIKNALNSDRTYLFLTGNPGIGKTTAIVEFLKERKHEGFLFFYVSPRKQVNLDIIEKFKDAETGNLDDEIFCMNTNSQLIADNFPPCVVNYYSNKGRGNFMQKAVNFIDASQEIQRQPSRQQALERRTEDEIVATNRKCEGVLSCLCEAIHTAIECEISNNIVATACIQSLRITANGKNTLEYFENIFKSARNTRDGNVIPAEMRRISARIKHLFIMIDEITGDDSGVEFLNGISRILSNYKLSDSENGFNTKVIVADASIVDANVIQQHLSEPSPEPDKIFFRRASSQANEPLWSQEFEFKEKPALIINANSYPASSLTVTYKVFVESVKFDEDTFAEKRDNLKNTVRSQIVDDINALWKQPDTGQILVYIQDKRKLQELIEKIQKQRGEFVKNKDYLEIHANLSDRDKQEIHQFKNRVKVIFMTSSASRGLSFPKAKHILVEIPRFRVESNLMEIIQVIYRGRGSYIENGAEKTLDDREKELIFYLCDRAIYSADDKQLSLRESVINLLNILLIIKTCVMTRIKGYGQLGRSNFLMIPIGGKSVSSAGQTFSGQMANLIKDLKNEHRRLPSHKLLQEVYTSLEQLLSRAEFVLNSRNPVSPRTRNPVSWRNRVSAGSENYPYLELREVFNAKFSDLIAKGFDNLLNFGNIQHGHINGSLLVVPIAEEKLEETYEMRLMEIATHATKELVNKMLEIHRSSDYPERLRSAIKNAIELVDKVRDYRDKTQFLAQNSQRLDQYYALPLFTFISGEAMSKYFADDPEEAEDERFRDILATYIHHLYPADKTLPIGHKYRDFPFVVFRSYSLEEMREKIFTDKYLLTSNELNVLNLILSQAE